MSEQSKKQAYRDESTVSLFFPYRNIYIHIYIYIYFAVVVVVVVFFCCCCFLLFFCFKLALHQNVQSRLFFEKPNFLKLLHEAWDLYLAGLKRIL